VRIQNHPYASLVWKKKKESITPSADSATYSVYSYSTSTDQAALASSLSTATLRKLPSSTSICTGRNPSPPATASDLLHLRPELLRVHGAVALESREQAAVEPRELVGP
jgi:hypothetical protein